MWVYDDRFTEPTRSVLLRSVKNKVKNEYAVQVSITEGRFGFISMVE